MISHTRKNNFQTLWLGCALVAAAFVFCSSDISDPNIVALVNGEPITVPEFMACLVYKYRAETYAHFASYGDPGPDFWNQRFNGKRPIDYARNLTLKNKIAIKVQQILLKRDGIQPDISYSAFQKALAEENARRKIAVASHEIIYGPVTWGEAEYFDHLFSDNVTAWKTKIGYTRFPFPEDQARKVYEANRQSYKIPDFLRIQVIAISDTAMPRNDVLRILDGIHDDLQKGQSVADVIKRAGPKVTSYETTFDESTTKGDELGRPLQRQEALKLRPGDISDIVNEGGNYLVMQCLERKSDRYASFERMHDLIVHNYIDEQYHALIDKMIKHAKVTINTRVYEQVYPQ